MHKTNNQTKAYLFAILSVLFWSTSASAFKITLHYADFKQLILISTFASVLAIFGFIVIFRKIKLLFKISVKELYLFLFLGFLNPFLYYLILFKAYSLLPAQLAQPLNFIWPIMIVLISIPILGQNISFKSIFAVFVSFFGVLVISTRGNFKTIQLDNPLGIFLALSSSVVWAFFWVLSVKNKTDGIIKLFYLFLFGFVYVLFYFLLFSPKSFPCIYGIIGSVYIGFFEMGFTFIFWYYALYFSKTTARVNNLIYLTPFFSLMFIALFVKEKILLSTISGLILILCGIVIQNSKKSSLNFFIIRKNI